jgi:hypothetical protein
MGEDLRPVRAAGLPPLSLQPGVGVNDREVIPGGSNVSLGCYPRCSKSPYLET